MRMPVLSWMICVIGLLSVAALWVVRPPVPTESPSQNVAGVTVGGPFSLIDQDGHTKTDKSWQGKYLILYFGFTHCPDVCPLGLNNITEALNALPEETVEKIQPVFITVDPLRDDVAALKNYVPLFHKKLVGLTGTEKQIEAVKTSYRVYAQKQGAGPNYMVNHSAFTYLIAPNGELLHAFPHNTAPSEMADAIKKFVGKN